MKYAIWNNKGGVGKSFLTFILSCEYARLNPDKRVYVVDMCPQANVSEIILGGNSKGSQNLQAIITHNDDGGRKTIGGYFDSRLRQPQTLTEDEATFATEAHKLNGRLPSNVHLIAGDSSLEVQAEAINQIANQTLPQGTWKNVHSWLKDLLDVLSSEYPDSVFFIDCNPSFAAYTELAIIAADKLIVPCTADSSSARAVNNIGQLIYGHNVPSQYQSVIFANKVVQENLTVPSIHMILLNRSTQYHQKASKAFGAMFDNIKNISLDLLKSEPKSRGALGEDSVFSNIPDTHTVAIVASHKGMPVNKIKAGPHTVHGKRIQVNPKPLERYKKAIGDVAIKL